METPLPIVGSEPFEADVGREHDFTIDRETPGTKAEAARLGTSVGLATARLVFAVLSWGTTCLEHLSAILIVIRRTSRVPST